MILIAWMLVHYVRVAWKKTEDKIGLKAAATLIVCVNLTVASYIPWLSVVMPQLNVIREKSALFFGRDILHMLYGCIWLAVAVLISIEIKRVYNREKGHLPAKIAGVALAVVIILLGAVDYKAFIKSRELGRANIESTFDMLEGIESDTIIISDSNEVQGLLAYYLNRDAEGYKVCLYQEEPDDLIKETVPGIETLDDPIDIANYLDAGKTVLFMGSADFQADLLKEWNDAYSITSASEGNYIMDRYRFEVFELSR